MVFKDANATYENVHHRYGDYSLGKFYKNHESFAKIGMHRMQVKQYTAADFLLFATFFALGYLACNFLRPQQDERA